jgi:alpha-N-arabinofuranosidase
VIDSILDDYAGLIAYVKGMKQSDHDVHVSFDEWNVWYKARGGVAQDGQWGTSPALLEEVYNLEDALVCAQYMNSFIRRADVVKVACLAQLVNVIAAVLTRPEGSLKQSIYYPFALYSKNATGISLTPAVIGPSYDAGERGEVNFIDASASFDVETGDMSLFLVNRSVDTDSTVTIDLSDRTIVGKGTVQIITGDDPKLANSWEQPESIVPAAGVSNLKNGVLTIEVPKLGMAVVSGVRTEER